MTDSLFTASKNEIIEAIEKHKLIAILRNVETEKLIKVAEALYQGGIRLVEVPYSKNGENGDKHIAEQIKMLAEHFKGKMLVGAGTVLTENQVQLTKISGGSFIISPDTCEAVIKETVRSNMVSIPGAFSPTEITNATRFGADFVKLFPAGSLGTSYIKAVKAPLKNVKLLAVGGINEQNAAEFIKSGVKGVGIGGSFTKREWIEAESFDKIRDLAEKCVKAVKL